MSEAAGFEQSEGGRENQERIKEAESIIEQIRLGFGESLKARGVDAENLAQYPKDREFWFFHWEDSAVEDPQECQRIVCQQLLESISVLSKNHQSVRNLKRMFGLEEDSDINLQDLLGLTGGRQTRTQREEADRRAREERERQGQEEERRRQETETRRRAEREQRRQEETRRKEEEERRRKEEEKTRQSASAWEMEMALFWRNFWESQRYTNTASGGGLERVRTTGLRVAIERIASKAGSPEGAYYVEIRGLVRNLAINPGMPGVGPLTPNAWSQFLSSALTPSFESIEQNAGKNELRKIRGRIAKAIHPDIAARYSENTSPQEKKLTDIFMKEVNAAVDSIVKNNTH